MRNFKINSISVRALLLISACALISSACVEVGVPAGENEPWGELNPLQGMHSSPSYKAQEAQPNFKGGPASMRVPPPATVPTDFRHYAYAGEAEAASVALENPVPINAETLRYGQLAYETTCIVCHGANGSGDGFVVEEGKIWPAPPSLLAQRARGFSDGEIYHIITHGRQRMWSYKSQLHPIERWAVVNYVRALQRAQNPEPQDQKLVDEN